MVKEGNKAAEFELDGIDEGGAAKRFTLADFKGKQLILYFYPKDNTPGCTTEACDFTENLSAFSRAGVAVAGVSPDSVDSHVKFREKHGLKLVLLSDPDKKAAEAYGAYGEKKLYGKITKGIIRSTFLIGPDGVVEKAWRGVKAAGHAAEVLRVVKG